MTIRRVLLLVLALVSPFALPRPAAAHPGPPLSVPPDRLAAALSCPRTFTHAEHEPVLTVHGTFVTAEENWSFNYGLVLPAMGFDVCTVTLPNRALDDVQVAAEYVVHAIRTIHRRAGRPVDVMGLSQGGLEPRWAVRWWPSARRAVDDLVTLATPNHGTILVNAALAATGGWCFPACLQMQQGSAFITALNGSDETPGRIDYTSIYSLTDELVQPVMPEPAAALEGASNVAVQDLCPGRVVDHIALTVDAAAFALVLDAFTHDGPADPARVDRSVCTQLTFPGVSLPPLLTLPLKALTTFPQLSATRQEPPLAAYALPGAGEVTGVSAAPVAGLPAIHAAVASLVAGVHGVVAGLLARPLLG